MKTVFILLSFLIALSGIAQPPHIKARIDSIRAVREASNNPQKKTVVVSSKPEVKQLKKEVVFVSTDTIPVPVTKLKSFITKKEKSKVTDGFISSSTDTVITNTMIQGYKALIAKTKKGALYLYEKDGIFSGRIVNKNYGIEYELENIGGAYFLIKKDGKSLLVHDELATEEDIEKSSSDLAFESIEEPTYAEQLAAIQKGAFVIWLDFDGAYVTGTLWNEGANPYLSVASSGFTEAQNDYIVGMVQEDYAALNIIVTKDSTLFYAAPAKKKAWVIVTTSNEWYGVNYGGAGLTGSLYWGGALSPSFVFSDLQTYVNVREAVAHEAGHPFGLEHAANVDANGTWLGYYDAGFGSGQTSGGNIMGSPYGKNMTVFGMVPVFYSMDRVALTNQYDVFTSYSSSYPTPKLKPDDVGNRFITARNVQKGIVMKALKNINDSDYYKINVPNASVTFTAAPKSFGANNANANLDVKITLYDRNGAFVAASNNSTTLDATLTQTLTAGIYYVLITSETVPNLITGFGMITAGNYSISYNY